MRAEIYWIDGPWPGRLAIAPRPRGGDWLADELASWKSAGVGKVVSTLTAPEMTDLDLATEENEASTLELEYESFPIEDRNVPDVAASVGKLQEWEGSLEAGKTLVVHCRQGIGRSSLVAVSLLVLAGQSPQDAWAKVEAARGRPVPDTEEQKKWPDRLQRFASASR